MKAKTIVNSNTKRQRSNRRHACQILPLYKAETSYERPVHISVYLNRIMDTEGKWDKKKLCELFNTENYG